MKYLKKTIFIIFLFSATLSFTCCGPKIDLLPWQIIVDAETSEKDADEEMDLGNVPLDILEGQLMTGIPLMMQFQEHNYQYQRANNVDMFSGYFNVSHSAFSYGGPLAHSYSYPNTYFRGPFEYSKAILPYLYHAYFYGEEHEMPEWKAIAQICYAYCMQELTDIYGPIPYDDFRNLKQTPPLKYISEKEAYKRITTDLQEAVETLKQRQPSSESLKRIEGAMGGYSDLQWQNWVKFANSLLLRMAMNVVKADPAMAQSLAEKAVMDEIGVFKFEDTNFQQSLNNNPTHPLYIVSSVWNDLRLGASLENIAKRLENPLLDSWFNKNSMPIKAHGSGTHMKDANADFVGMRQGCDVDPATEPNGYGAFSAFKVQYMPRTYMKVVEVLFLQAEGALRGWSMGDDTQAFYEKGIRRSFEENNAGGLEEYLEKVKEDLDMELGYEDYYKAENSIEGRVNIGVAWNDDDTNELKLEKIITQKYIANFPMSVVAWTTFRRTAYPRLFPVPEKNKWSDGSFDTELQIRRLPYDNKGNANDIKNIIEVEIALGQKNTAGARLWWDVPTEERDDNGRIIPVNF